MDIAKVKEQTDRAITDLEEIQSGELNPVQVADNVRCAIHHLKQVLAEVIK